MYTAELLVNKNKVSKERKGADPSACVHHTCWKWKSANHQHHSQQIQSTTARIT